MRVLVTGGAGYIGSHVVKHLGEAGHEVVVLDDLSTGNAWAVSHGRLVVGDVRDSDLLDVILSDQRFDAVMHFAAKVSVPESLEKPLLYYSHNVDAVLRLIEAMQRNGVQNVVFSSTAAVYGNAQGKRVTEQTPLNPISPYGSSKAMAERIIQDVASATKLNYSILRYFNVAGADPRGRLGQCNHHAAHLIKVAIEAALGRRKSVSIYGTDYETPDGSGVRDYIHVDDLAVAHVLALDKLIKDGRSTVYNCGYGRGWSVKEVINAVKRISGTDFPVHAAKRRPGDVEELVADNSRLVRELGWQPNYPDIAEIVLHTLEWEQSLKTPRLEKIV